MIGFKIFKETCFFVIIHHFWQLILTRTNIPLKLIYNDFRLFSCTGILERREIRMIKYISLEKIL